MHSYRALVVTFTLVVLVTLVGPAAAEHPYTVDKQQLPNGDTLIKVSAPLPPPLFLAPGAFATDKRAPALLPNVPAFNWCHGCAATSGAMLAGFYDNNGYPNMYAGPTNGGVCPLTNSAWGYGHCPLSATQQGYDGLGVRGHVDDYWIATGNNDPDPYITGAWIQHIHADCTGDFMKTSQSAYGNSDGSTMLYYLGNGNPYSGTGATNDDGAYGLRLFLESRGYTVVSCYTQLIYGYDGNTNGMTFAEYQQEIDAGRPVLIHVEGHTMLGYGYETTGQLIWLHDTWDWNNHTMAWGGSYPYYGDELAHWGVTCVELAPSDSLFIDGFESGTTAAWSATAP